MAQSSEPSLVETISAVTLVTRDMRRAVAFYRALGFELAVGGEEAAFTTFRAGSQYLNISPESHDTPPGPWGRVIFHVSDVDAMYRRCLERDIAPDFAPRDAPWGERYFHVTDPDGHEISFARRIR